MSRVSHSGTGIPACAITSCDIAVSSPVPTNIAVPPECDCARRRRSAKCAVGQRLVTHFAPTATATSSRPLAAA